MPGYNKHADVRLLLEDLAKLDLRGIEMWCVLADNASNPPLSTIPTPPGLVVEHLRLETNTGGAGGFNAGMAHVLRGQGISASRPTPDFLWCLDSDARVSKRSLRHLVRAMVRHKKLGVAGSALTDQRLGYVYELGGVVRRHNGEWGPAGASSADHRMLVPADYIAACSLLVRTEDVRATGLMPDVFIHGDDVLWSIAICQKTGKKAAGVPLSKVYHPHFISKWQTWTRYYGCRNSFAPIDRLGLGRWVRARKALVELKRAAAQSLMGMDDLAELHLQGLEDAAAGRIVGQHPRPSREHYIKVTKPTPFKDLPKVLGPLLEEGGKRRSLFVHDLLVAHPVDMAELKAQLKAMGIQKKPSRYWKRRDRATALKSDAVWALGRFCFGMSADVAIVPTGWPTGWFRAPVSLQVTPDGFLVQRISRAGRVAAMVKVMARGLVAAAKLWRGGQQWQQLVPAPQRVTPAPSALQPSSAGVIEPKPRAMVAAPTAVATG